MMYIPELICTYINMQLKVGYLYCKQEKSMLNEICMPDAQLPTALINA